MATGPDLSSSAAPDAAPAAAAKKDRHIVTWSAEEDGVLRAQIALHGTDNWTIIAAQFKDKTARQCRRRWYNYLNSECKKGGWSREEDMLLCEAQKVLGNRWTEIAKVVSGRTDNAVKNRFSTLCKRRAKDEEVFQENGAPCSNTNAKRILTQTGCLTPGAAGSSLPINQTRYCSSDLKENSVPNMRLFGQEKSTQQDSRQPLAIISPNNLDNVNTVNSQNLVATTTTKQLYGSEQHCVKREGNFLNKDDPKVATLLQQADLLCSLATKIQTENTSQSMDEAWQQLQHHLVKKEDNEMSENSMSGIASLLEELDDLIVDPYENKEEDEQKLREQNGRIDVDNEHCIGPSQTSKEVTSNMASDQMMEDCPADNGKEYSSLCRNVHSGSMEPCPGFESLSEVAKDSRLQHVESISPVLADIDDLIVDPYESGEENEQKLREQNGQIDVHGDLSNGLSQTFVEVTSDMAPDQKMEACPVDNCKVDNSLCRNVLYGSVEPCPGAEISASENLSEVAEDSRLQSMESAPPVLTDFDDFIVDPYESNEEDEQKLREQNGQIDVHDERSNGPSQTSMEVTSDMAPDKKMEDCKEDNSLCRNMLSGSMEPRPGAEVPASESLSEVAEDSRLQCMESASPVLTDFQSKDGAKIPASENHCEVAEDSRPQLIEFTSRAHTVLQAKAGADILASPKISEVAIDSKLASMEFTSPAHTVSTFQPYADDMPTPKFTASERNFLLSVIELTSPGSRPETSQQPSCKRALLNSL